MSAFDRDTPALPEAVGRSDAFLAAQEELSLAAKCHRPVVIAGERGTGKELAAARVHYLSPRWDGPYVPVNCAGLAPSLLPSELFGHEPGAFTGAAVRRIGRFEAADEGTLFLDEISRMSPAAQEMVLRAVEYGVIERLGGRGPVPVDTRVVAATNEDLPSLARAGKFRRDLLDRLGFMVVTLPPLRARNGDVPLLADHFAARMAVEMGLDDPPRFTSRAMADLQSHSWPGNVRELKNTVERAVFTARDGLVRSIPLDPFASPHRLAPPPATPESATPPPPAEPGGLFSLPLAQAVDELKKTRMHQALDQCRHNQARAARLLGLTYDQFRGLYRKYGGEE